MEYTKWVAFWGCGTSITNQKEARFAKDLTLRYPFYICFSGSALRFRFSNFTGKEPVTLRASVARWLLDTTNATERTKVSHSVPGKQLEDEKDPRAFAERYDSGDHLHPSEAGYQAMAAAVPEELIRNEG